MDLKEYFNLNIAERAKVCEEIANHSTYSYQQVYGTLNGLFERYMIFGFVSPADVPMDAAIMLHVYNNIQSDKQ